MNSIFVIFDPFLQHKTGLDNVHRCSYKCPNSSSYAAWATFRNESNLVTNEKAFYLLL